MSNSQRIARGINAGGNTPGNYANTFGSAANRGVSAILLSGAPVGKSMDISAHRAVGVAVDDASHMDEG